MMFHYFFCPLQKSMKSLPKITKYCFMLMIGKHFQVYHLKSEEEYNISPLLKLILIYVKGHLPLLNAASSIKHAK